METTRRDFLAGAAGVVAAMAAGVALLAALLTTGAALAQGRR